MIEAMKYPITFLPSHRIWKPLKGAKAFGTVWRKRITALDVWHPVQPSMALHGKKMLAGSFYDVL